MHHLNHPKTLQKSAFDSVIFFVVLYSAFSVLIMEDKTLYEILKPKKLGMFFIKTLIILFLIKKIKITHETKIKSKDNDK